DAEWRILDPLLPDRGERGPAGAGKRRTVNGILWVLRTGAPWRDMPERYGNWNSVFVRFMRWSKLPWILGRSATGSREADLSVFAKLFEDRLKWRLGAETFSRR